MDGETGRMGKGQMGKWAKGQMGKRANGRRRIELFGSPTFDKLRTNGWAAAFDKLRTRVG